MHEIPVTDDLTDAYADRRRFPRISQTYVARFRMLSDRPGPHIGGGWDMVTIRNISAGGALFSYNRGIDRTELLDLRINFPACEGPIRCTAKPVRVSQVGAAVLYHIAVMFTEIDPASRSMIDSLIRKRYASRP